MELDAKEDGFGLKTIGFFGSFCLLVNSITGAGMIQIPGMFQEAGWLFPLVCFLGVALLSGLSASFLARGLTQVPGNLQFERRWEYANLAKLLLPRRLYLFMLWTLIFNFQASNLSAIVVSAQSADLTFLSWGRTCGLVFNPDDGSPPGFQCVTRPQGEDEATCAAGSAFGDATTISLGYLVTMAFTLPMGFLNLDSNIWVQIGGFWLLLFCLAVWGAQFMATGLDYAMPAVEGKGLGTVLSLVVFNYGFVIAVPSWLNEKHPGVNVGRVLWASVVFSTAVFLVLGMLGGSAYRWDSGCNVISLLHATPSSWKLTLAANDIFPLAALLSGIPVYSVIVRYNLLENKIMSKFWANMFAVVLPWAAGWLFTSGTLLTQLINWSSAFLFVTLNFFFPILLFLKIKERVVAAAPSAADADLELSDLGLERMGHVYDAVTDLGKVPPPGSSSSGGGGTSGATSGGTA